MALETNRSIWEATETPAAIPPLTRDETVDVCVIGAGIAGLSAAYRLVQAGRSVIVLDQLGIGRGMTARTTAHLVNALDDRYCDLEKVHGEEGSRLAAESHTMAIDEIERTVQAERIDCAFERVDGFLFAPPGDSSDLLMRELASIQRAGLRSVEHLMRFPIAEFDTGPCLRFPRQAQFHPLLYTNGLAKAILARRGRIHLARVIELEGGADPHVETEGGFRVNARSVVVCTNAPIGVAAGIHAKQAPYMTYVIGARVPQGSLPAVLLWDTAQEPGMDHESGPVPYHYVRLERGRTHDVLVVGGEDHRTGQAQDGAQRFVHLEEWARVRFPMIDEVEYRWSGQVVETADGLAYIGPAGGDDSNVYIATGDSGNGLTHGTIAGMLISDLIQGRENPWSEVYDPARKRLRSLGVVAKRTLNAMSQLKDYVTGGDVASEEEIPRGVGGIVRDGTSKLAIYVDPDGVRHRLSAVCPHMKCIVSWNQTERTWDCPCHGSRFDCEGRMIMGPATADLKPVD